MERKRRDKINELELEKARLEKTQEREKQILIDLKDLKISEEIYNKKKTELESKIKLRDERIQEIVNEISSTLLGNNDLELDKKSKNVQEIVKNKENIAQKKKDDKKVRDEENKKKLDEKPKENDWRYKKDYTYFYNRFLSFEEDLPDYLREKLKNMPNNKGYSFKNCWFFGELPIDKRNDYTCIFDRQKNGLQVVHVNSPDCYRIIETPKFDNKTFYNNLKYCVYEKWKNEKAREEFIKSYKKYEEREREYQQRNVKPVPLMRREVKQESEWKEQGKKGKKEQYKKEQNWKEQGKKEQHWKKESKQEIHTYKPKQVFRAVVKNNFN